MGRMTDVLNKIQESRLPAPESTISEVFHIKEQPSSDLNKVLCLLVAGMVLGLAAVITISYKIDRVGYALKVQEQRFDQLTASLNNSKLITDDRFEALNNHLNDEIQNRNIQITNLNLADTHYYNSILKSLNENSLQIQNLDQYTYQLNSQLKSLQQPTAKSSLKK